MKRLLRLPSLLRLTLVFFIALAFQNCSEDKIKDTTDETLNITDYMRQNEDYSMFLEILNVTNYASFMNTYGTYTIFVPSNSAVKQYLKDVGASSLSEIPLVDLQNIAKLHILDKKILTTSFTDGKIATPSLYGQYLVTGARSVPDGKMAASRLTAKVSEGTGVSSITVNKTANIIVSNIEAGNGVIHVIDKVLMVANKTLAQTIEEDPNLSLFTEVLKATGWYDKLNKPLTKDANNISSYLSVLAQTNEVYNNTKWVRAVGDTIRLNTLANLKARYSKTINGVPGDPMKLTDSLNLYASYHILTGLQYLADLAASAALVTEAPLEIISAKLSKDTILLNQDVYNGVLEKGVAIDRNLSDVTASNGVLHYVNGNFAIKKRVPTPVYFEFTDIAEFRKMTTYWRKPIATPDTKSSDHLAVRVSKENAGVDVTWDLKTSSDTNGYICYVKDAEGNAINKGVSACWGRDALEIFRFRDANAQNVAFKTPVIIKGRYKIWISYRQKGTKLGNMKVFFNGVELPRQVNLMEEGNMSSTTSEAVLESQGYKRYTEPFYKTVNCRLVGIVDIATTGRHTLTLQSQGNFGDGAWLDMAEFRPVGMNQLWPKFAQGKNTLVQQP